MQINTSIARRIAEKARGKGGTVSTATTRKGIRYFSCSGHGGYVVDISVLTNKEKEDLLTFIHDGNKIAIKTIDNKIVKSLIDKRWTEERQVLNQSIYNAQYALFEEDCNRAVIEYITGVRAGRDTTKEALLLSLMRWNKEHIKSEDREYAQQLHDEETKTQQERLLQMQLS